MINNAPEVTQADIDAWEVYGPRIFHCEMTGPEALACHRVEQGGFIVANGTGDRWRAWEQGMPVWVDDRTKATRYHRREDAGAVHAEDEDAWRIEPFAPAA